MNNNLLALRQYINTITKGVINLSDRHLLEVENIINNPKTAKIVLSRYNNMSKLYVVERTIYLCDEDLYEIHLKLINTNKIKEFYKYSLISSSGLKYNDIYSVSSFLID